MKDLEYYKKYEPIDGKWYIKRELGRGAYGTVFEIERNDFTRVTSALKIITIPSAPEELATFRRENPDLDEEGITSYFYGMVEEFIKEIQLMSQLRGYTNIVNYEDHDVKKHDGEIGWDIFIRMELLTPLREHYKTHKPQEEDIIKLGIDICKALEACDTLNIIHRDIKPSNIFVSKEGEYKLGDFGVARTLEKAAFGLSKKGTYTYMAPEVYNGGRYNSNVDIYSLGIVMYRLLNDNLEPFRKSKTYADGERALETRMRGDTPVNPPANTSEGLASVILKACSYNPDDRYRTAADMRRDLEIILSGADDDYEDDFDKTVGVYDALGMERLKRYAEEIKNKKPPVSPPPSSGDAATPKPDSRLKIFKKSEESTSPPSVSTGSGLRIFKTSTEETSKPADSVLGSSRFFRRAANTDITAKSAVTDMSYKSSAGEDRKTETSSSTRSSKSFRKGSRSL